jgi:hypothetical protein
MVRQRRAPGVKHRGDADAGAEVLGIGRDGGHGLGRGGEQDVVDRGLVLIGDVRDGGRQREHHVEVRHGKEVSLARGEPFLGGGALALGTMPVAATVVGDDRVGAALAARHMAAERGRAAALDGAHHLHLFETDVTDVGATPRRSVVAEDIRDLQGRTGHGAVTPAAGLCGPSWASCAAATAGRAGSRCRRSCRSRRACSAPSYPICRGQAAPG